MPVWWKRLNRLITDAESRWSLWQLIKGTGLVASFAFPAWATWAAEVFADYSPLSWILAGFCGVFITSITYLIFQFGRRIRIRTSFDSKFIESHPSINPLESTFQGVRIYVNDFVLPSHPFVDSKSFIDCEIVGPANIFFAHSNSALEIKLPSIDAVLLDHSAKFNSGFVFTNCLFRRCSFQRITLFVQPEEYENFHKNPNFNWISTGTIDQGALQLDQRAIPQKTHEPEEPPKPEEEKQP